jgi:hypothetical protein
MGTCSFRRFNSYVVPWDFPFVLTFGREQLKWAPQKRKIVEALRVAYSIGGNEALFTSALVLQTLFKHP